MKLQRASCAKRRFKTQDFKTLFGNHLNSLSCSRILFFIFSIGVCSTSIIAQQMPKPQFTEIIPPSPNVTAFAKYGNIPVSTYTGVPQISIPLYTIQVRDIGVPISLSYHASGIKVAEEASRVGLGWVLNCGGVISRNVVGQDDFFGSPTAYMSLQNQSPLLPQGPFEPSRMLQGGVMANFISTKSDGTTEEKTVNLDDYIYGSTLDYEPDQFTYNFLSQYGKFILTPARSSLGIKREVILEKQDKIDIVPADNGSSWVVTSSDGFKYTFNDSETVDTRIKSAWYLSEIKSPLGEVVTFTYTPVQNLDIRSLGVYNESNEPKTFSCDRTVCTPLQALQTTPAVRRTYTSVYLSSVTWSQGKIDFEMDDRLDLEGDKRIKSMKVSRKIKDSPEEYELMEQQVFEYGYFDYQVLSNYFSSPDATQDRLRKRLKLLSVTRQSATGKGEKEKHSFTYYETEVTDQLPGKNSFGRDHWGYSNGGQGQSLIPKMNNAYSTTSGDELGVIVGNERNPSKDHIKAFTLKEITYPTKGKTVFFYGINDFELVPQTDQTYVYKKPGSKAYAEFGTVKNETLDLTAQYKSPYSGQTIPMEIKVAFVGNNLCSVSSYPNAYVELISVDGGTPFRITYDGLMSLPSCATPGQSDCKYCNSAGGSQNTAWEYKLSKVISPGQYTLRFATDGASNVFSRIAFSYDWYVDAAKLPELENSQYAAASGLRIERIEDYEPETDKTVNVRVFNYHHKDAQGKEHSYGKRMREPRYSYYERTWEKASTDIDGNGVPDPDNHHPLCYDCIHLLMQSDSYMPVTGSLGNIVGYSQVIESLGPNGENGSVTYEYINDVEQTWTVSDPYIGVRSRSGFISSTANPLNGSLLSTVTRNAANIAVSGVTNLYDTKYDRTIYGMETRRISAIGMSTTDILAADPLYGINRANIMMNFYPAMRSKFPFLYRSINNRYDVNGAVSLSTTSDFAYDNKDHLQLTRSVTEKSDGKKTIITYTYPGDYPTASSGTVERKMADTYFMHSTPIETTQLEQLPNQAEKIVNRNLSVYEEFNNRIQLKESRTLDNSSLIDAADAAYNYSPGSVIDNAKYRKVFGLEYDDDGNLKKMTKESDIPIAYLWGHNKKMPVAKITNATVEEVYFTSFENDEGASFSIDDKNMARSGIKVLNASSFTFPNTYTPDLQKTLMSYWYWKDNAWIFSGEVPYQITINTNGSKLDEIRAFPKGAQMTTSTYLPMFGVLSQTDANNNTVYYEYDQLGKLKLVRDNNRKIIKSYEYAYKK